jgi:1-acyl-sn-glycerol-3-phosphate acyltransferase
MAAAVLTIMVFLSVLFLTIFFPFDRKRKLAHAQGFWWADALVTLNPFLSLKIIGMENVDKDKTYVIVANHQSMADIAIIYKTHMQFKWVAKDALFQIPVFGWCMSMMKYIRLSRGEFGSIRDVYNEAGEWLNKGVSVLFFPEGTRSHTDEMNSFKSGAFKLATKEKKAVLPILISGTRNIIPRGSWIFKEKADIRLQVLPPVDISNYKAEDFVILRDKVREQLLDAGRNTRP